MPRFIVVDLNALDSGLHRFVEPDDQIVVTPSLLGEIADSKRSKHLNCFPKWYRDKGEQIWVSHEWITLEEREKSPRDRTIGLEWRDNKFSALLRRASRDPDSNLAQIFCDYRVSPEHKKVEEMRDAFAGICERYARELRRSVPGVCHSLAKGSFVDEARALIQEPVCGTYWPPELKGMYRLPEWKKALNRFPDVKAIGRMSRMLCWYGMAIVGGQTSRGRNNYEDSTYAFVASYTGHLATEDRRLIEMVRAVFPYVNIVQRKS